MPNSVQLSELTTLGLGGPAPDLVSVVSAGELAAVVGGYDRAGRGVLILGGGSNLVVADAGIPTPVVRIQIPGIEVRPAGSGAADSRASVTIGAGVNWDDAVLDLIGRGLCGLAPLSGIPGSTGATPVQNVGAYGTDIADVLESVQLYDRSSGVVKTVATEELSLGYRTSSLRGTGLAVITAVTLRLAAAPGPVRYAELAAALGIGVGDVAPETEVRAAVLRLRRRKGMLIEAGKADPDTRSAGSFFTNPIVTAGQAAEVDAAIRRRLGDVSYPRYPAGQDGRGPLTKLSAAWLIERAGFGKGHPGAGGRVGISTKHTLALVNHGGSTADLLALAREIRDGVRAAFGVVLHPEPVLVGVTLDD